MSDNPFQAPVHQPPQHYPQGTPEGLGNAYVKQIPVIASLMIAQGGLMLLMSAALLVNAFLFTRMDQLMPADEPKPPQLEQMLEIQQSIFPIVFGAISAGVGVLSILHFVAAYFGFHRKYRIFGIAVMILGLSTILTVYCAPTSIGLAIYGMIIYFNPAVIGAFEAGKPA